MLLRAVLVASAVVACCATTAPADAAGARSAQPTMTAPRPRATKQVVKHGVLRSSSVGDSSDVKLEMAVEAGADPASAAASICRQMDGMFVLPTAEAAVCANATANTLRHARGLVLQHDAS
jgi:hypothetical protein